jgi:hypothetical protein
MRLEIIIPISARPELVDELVTEKAEAIPDYLAIVDQALQSPNRLENAAEVDAYLADLCAEWDDAGVSARPTGRKLSI